MEKQIEKYIEELREDNIRHEDEAAKALDECRFSAYHWNKALVYSNELAIKRLQVTLEVYGVSYV